MIGAMMKIKSIKATTGVFICDSIGWRMANFPAASTNASDDVLPSAPGQANSYPSAHQGADPLYLLLDNSEHKCPLPPPRRPGQLYVRSTIRAGIDLRTTRGCQLSQ